jgi:hypothetical protein
VPSGDFGVKLALAVKVATKLHQAWQRHVGRRSSSRTACSRQSGPNAGRGGEVTSVAQLGQPATHGGHVPRQLIRQMHGRYRPIVSIVRDESCSAPRTDGSARRLALRLIEHPSERAKARIMELGAGFAERWSGDDQHHGF